MMVRFFTIFAALGFSACGPPPLYVTADGVSVFATESGFAFSEADITRSLEVARYYFAQTSSVSERDLEANIAGLSIFHEDPPIFTPEGDLVRAYYLPNPPSIIIERQPCVGATALPHELIHAYHQPFFGPSGDHPRRFFGGPGTAERLAWSQTFRETCVPPEVSD